MSSPNSISDPSEPVVVNPDTFVRSVTDGTFWFQVWQGRRRMRNGLKPMRWYRRGTFTKNVNMCSDCLIGVHNTHQGRPCSCVCRGELAPLLRHEERGR